jgi:hypothetical protein
MIAKVCVCSSKRGMMGKKAGSSITAINQIAYPNDWMEKECGGFYSVSTWNEFILCHATQRSK